MASDDGDASNLQLPPCELCEADEQPHAATHVCLDCQQHMCALMGRGHLKMRATADHRVVEQPCPSAPAEPAPVESTGRFVYTSTCEVHVGMPLQLYDPELRKAICVYCVVQPEHKGHDCMPLHEVEEQAQAELKACVAQAKGKLQALRKSGAEQRSAMQALDVAADAAQTKLHAAGEQVRSGCEGEVIGLIA